MNLTMSPLIAFFTKNLNSPLIWSAIFSILTNSPSSPSPVRTLTPSSLTLIHEKYSDRVSSTSATILSNFPPWSRTSLPSPWTNLAQRPSQPHLQTPKPPTSQKRFCYISIPTLRRRPSLGSDGCAAVADLVSDLKIYANYANYVLCFEQIN